MDVLITHHEQRKTLRDSIGSLARQLSEEDTIYVVDAGSTDGSFHILESLDHDGKIELLYRDGVSRGRGRQIAFEESEDDIIVGQADLDTIFHPVLQQIEHSYKRIRSEKGAGILLVHGCFVSDRKTIESIGGWNDLQVHEDKDLWVRAEDDVALYQMPISAVKQHDNFEWESSMYRLKRSFQNYRDAIRLGIPSAALRKSYRNHLPVISWPINSVLISIAKKHANEMECYPTFEEDYPHPSDFNLRELTYYSLTEGGVLEPEILPVPDDFTHYKSKQVFPGKTSYH